MMVQTSAAVERHVVQFYDSTYPAASIARFLGEELRAGGGALVIATGPHRDAIAHALGDIGIDAVAAVARGQLVQLDAPATLVSFAGAPHDGLRAHVGRLLDDLAARFGRMRVYGELVDLLARDGKLDAALALETEWTALLAEYPAHLLCGYHLGAFDRQREGIAAVCEAHAEARADDTPTPTTRLEVELRHKSHLLQAAAEQLARLQQATAALSEAATPREVAEVVTRDLAMVVGADRVALTDDLVEETALPPMQAIACVPVSMGGRRFGAITFEYAREHHFSPPERALFEALARQTAVALDRARLYEEAARARDRAEQANRAKDEFLAMLGHELRNPMSPILTALELMRLRGGEQLAKERTIIERQVQHMVRLVDDLLDVARIAGGKIELRRRTVELADVLALAIETATPTVELHGHRLDVHVGEELWVDADASRLAQAIGNLITNAANYTPRGGVVHVATSSTDERVRVEVRDNGVGIEPRLLPRIFELFVQGSHVEGRSKRGLGLGLAIVRSLVELHGGTVSARSDGPGRGSVFAVELPRVVAPVEVARNVLSLRPRRKSHQVLLVDDNKDAAEALAEALSETGHAVRVAHDGPSALELARRAPVDVALLDIGLPVMDGYELAARLRGTLGAGTRLIALTGYGQEADRARARAAGFDAHVIKPAQLDELEAVIAGLFSE